MPSPRYQHTVPLCTVEVMLPIAAQDFLMNSKALLENKSFCGSVDSRPGLLYLLAKEGKETKRKKSREGWRMKRKEKKRRGIKQIKCQEEQSHTKCDTEKHMHMCTMLGSQMTAYFDHLCLQSHHSKYMKAPCY